MQKLNIVNFSFHFSLVALLFGKLLPYDLMVVIEDVLYGSRVWFVKTSILFRSLDGICSAVLVIE